MEDNSAIKKAGITKLNGLNYRTWAAIIKAIIKAKDAWEAIKGPPAPEAKTPIKDTDNKTEKSSNITELKI